MNDHIIKKYTPMTETTYYTLLALKSPRHGYGIMQFVSELTNQRIQMGTGTLYTMLGRLLDDNLIEMISEENGKKIYQNTNDGNVIVKHEIERLKDQIRNGEQIYGK